MLALSAVLILLLLVINRHRIRLLVHHLMERGWQSTFHHLRCFKVLEALYGEVNTFHISLGQRARQDLQEKALIYGEVRFHSFIKILQAAQPTSEDIFYDLGSGGGKAVFIAALAFNFKAAKGVEILADLQEVCVQLTKKLPTLPGFDSLHLNKPLAIEFMRNDFLEEDIRPATLIFINATCFSGELWQKLADKLVTAQIGARIIVVSQTLDNPPCFKLLYKDLHLMSWGLASVSIYERI